MLQRIPVNSDEIEVVCDLLWFVKREAGLSGVAEALWERLEPHQARRLRRERVDRAVAGEFTHPRVALDEDETALVSRLRSLLG